MSLKSRPCFQVCCSPLCVTLPPQVLLIFGFSSTEKPFDETPPFHSIIDEIGIQTLQDLSILQVSNTEIFNDLPQDFPFGKPSFIPFPLGLSDCFTWNLFSCVVLALSSNPKSKSNNLSCGRCLGKFKKYFPHPIGQTFEN